MLNLLPAIACRFEEGRLGPDSGEAGLLVVDEPKDGPESKWGSDGVVGQGFAEAALGVRLDRLEGLWLRRGPHRRGYGFVNRLGALEWASIAVAAFGEGEAAGGVFYRVDCGTHAGAGADDAATTSFVQGVDLG